MRDQHRPRRGLIASFAGSHAVRAEARLALCALGYEWHDGGTLDCLTRIRQRASRGLLYLVDERRLSAVPSIHSEPDTPMIVLRGGPRLEIDDPRVVGYAPRPATLAELYPLIQQALESTPRSAPRLRTRLSARCIRSDRRWIGSVTSLSVGGCLFHSREPLDDGARVNVQLALPKTGIVSARALCLRQRKDTAALAFSAPSPELTRSIGGFVTQSLAAG